LEAFTYPGVDLGFEISTHWQAYANLGYTYRIPTYTDLYYEDRTTVGNENLKPEEALATELGIRHNMPSFRFYAAYFDRRAENLIDYVKPLEEAPWEATNIQTLDSRGFETEINLPFIWNKQPQNLQLGYTYLSDDLREVGGQFFEIQYQFFKTSLYGFLQGRGQFYSSRFSRVKIRSASAAGRLYCSGCKCDLEPEILSDPGGCLQPFKSRVFGDQFGTHAGAQCETFSAIQLLKELV
jgi:iron complex outermembrane receptor protein